MRVGSKGLCNEWAARFTEATGVFYRGELI